MKKSFEGDLGFVFYPMKNGDLEIRHGGKFATKFSGSKAMRISEQIERGSFSEQQQLMARLTGNYKHGNERLAKNHSRNKR